MRKLSALIVLLALHTVAIAASPSVSIETGDGNLQIQVGAQRVANYVWNDPAIPRPFFANVCAPDGTPVTRTHPPAPVLDQGNDDHATFHPGIWLAFGDIGGADVWRLKARVRQVTISLLPTHEALGTGFRVRNRYETLDSPPKAIADEDCLYRILADSDGFFLVSRSVFKPVGAAFTFGDQEEMGMGVRLATGLSVKRGGAMENSEGGTDESGTWGKQARWCVGYGSAPGKTAGVLLMPGPANFRPSWFHSRDYGLMVANPFGQKAMTAPDDKAVPPSTTRVTKDSPLTLDFGAYVFSSPTGATAMAPEKHKRFEELLGALSLAH